MIYTSVTVRVNNNGTATSNNKVVLYRGDREVEIQITLAGNPFIVQDSTYAQLIIRRPDASPIITGVAPLKDSKVILTITEQNIDELTEVGSYGYQIRLYDDDMSARITLPPVENGLEVREPIVDEASGAIGRAMINYSLISRARAIDDNATFNEYDEYNRTYWADGDFITDVKMNKIEDALYTINQRVLSDATTAYITTNMQEDQKIGIGETLDISFEFSSPNLGRGTLKVAVDGVQKMSMYVEQEETTITLTEDYFKKGTNKLTLHVVDRAGKMSNELIFNVRYGSTEILSDFDSYSHYQYGASVRYYFTPISLDTSMELTFYMVIDGEIKPGMSCTSDVRGYYTFPNNLSIGAHYCQAYIIDGEGNQSNILEFNLIILDSYSIVIASDTRNPVIEEGAQLVLDYKVYMQYADTFITKTYVDGNLVNTGECGLATSYYRTTSLTEGTHTIRIEAWDMEERVHDYVTWTVTVTASTFERIMPATSGAIFMASASDKTNSDADRDKWVGKDQDNQNVTAQLYDFSYNNESGWVDNELILSGNSYVIVPVRPLAENARYGFTLDLEFTSRAIGVEDALVLELWDRTKNCGIKITTEQLILRSAEGNECSLYFENDANTSVIFVIDRNEAKAKIYLNGVMCSAFHLSDYDAGGTKVLEDFSVNADIKLGGSGYSKIRNLRVYQIALTTTEILNNYISNKISKEEQKELVKFQNGDGLPTLTVYCDFSGLGKDDKKPCKIVYVSTDEEKYGKSFTLDHYESELQYQGTSSMAYPIKNYRLNLRDENGDKLYYDFPFGKPECRFTLKADFMSSGHWQNTGLTKWVNDNLYNYNERDEKSMNPKKWYDINNGGSLTDTRECIYGFPCRLILVNDGTTPLNSGQNEPTPGNTKDMGIFNFNNDKDNTDTMGFDQDNFPNCMSFEVTANSDTSAGAFMSYKREYVIETINYQTGRIGDGLNTFGFINDGDTLTITSYSNSSGVNVSVYGADGIWKANHTINRGDSLTLTKGPDVEQLALFFGDSDGYFILNGSIVKPNNTENYGQTFVNPNDDMTELAYYQQSFEMRFPDPDDYNDWHGYLGINAGTMVTDYKHTDEGYSTTFWNWEETRLSISSSTVISKIECYYNDNLLAAISFNKDVGTATLIDGSNKIRLIFTEIPEEFYIGDTKYIFGNEVEEITLSDPYLGEEISPNYGLKRVIEWTDKCSDAEFVRDFEKYYHKDYTLRYFLLVMALGMVDNLGKNMMFDSWDGQIWAPRFYDCDTICSYDNSGDIKFDVDIEMEQGYWNTSSSRLWTRVRDLMHNDLVAKYNVMRQNGLSFESLMSYFYDEQIAKIPQKYYNMDFDVKYAPFGESYMGMAHGDGLEHLKRWLKNRLIFTDTLYDYAPSYGEAVTIRANTTEPMTLYIETYTPVYQHLSWFNGQMDKKKIDGKVAVAFTGTAMAATDQEVLIYGGSNIKRITGISSTNPNQILTANAPRLVELDASNSPLLSDLNMNKANLSSNTYLNRVNLRNCPLLGGNLRVNNSPLLREIDIRGTAIDGLMLPSSVRNLEVMRLPNAIRAITLNDATALHTLEFDPGVRMDSISMSNCNKLTNVINFDLLQTPVISLDNSYNTAKELYFRDTTDLTLRNMSNLERVIYTPNNEYDVFDMSKVTGAPNYKISTFNCPKLSTFMTTAPYRESYNNIQNYVDKEITVETQDVYQLNDSRWTGESGKFILYVSNGEGYAPQSTYKCTSYIEAVEGYKYTLTVDDAQSYVGIVFFDIDKVILEGSKGTHDVAGPSITLTAPAGTKYVRYFTSNGVGYKNTVTITNKAIVQAKDYGVVQPNTTFTANNLDISSTQFTDVKLLCTTDVNVLKLPASIKNFYCDSSFDLDTDWLEDGDYDVVHNELIEEYTTDYEGEVIRIMEEEISICPVDMEAYIYRAQAGVDPNSTPVENTNSQMCCVDFTRVVPGTNMICNSEWQNVHFFTEDKVYISSAGWNKTAVVPNNAYYFRANFYIGIIDDYILTYSTVINKAPNVIPSSADGSLIFSMYAPEKTSAPASGTWDLHGIQFNNFYTYGMNNDVKPNDDAVVKMYSGKNLKLFQGNVFRDNPCGTIIFDDNQKVRRVMSPIYLPKGSHTYAYSNGYNSTMYYVTELDGSIQQNLKYGQINITSEEGGYVQLTWVVNDPNWPEPIKWVRIDDVYYIVENVEVVMREDELGYLGGTYSVYDYIDGNVDSRETTMGLMNIQSISMPARYDDYAITIKEGNIAPTTHNTMFYPLLINESDPFRGTLSYNRYAGEYLSWSFAFLPTTSLIRIFQPDQDLINTYKYKYNAFYETDYEFDNPYEVARYTSSASGVLPTFNSEFTYTYDEIVNGDGTYTVSIATDSVDNLPTKIIFQNLTSLLTVEKLNTANVINMANMFNGCVALTKIKGIEKWNVSNVVEADGLFKKCSSITSLDLTNWQLSNVNTTYGIAQMFMGCSKLTEIKGVNNLLCNGNNIKRTDDMFNGCSSLTTLDLSGWDTSNVNNMRAMFAGCSKLTSIDVSSWDTSQLTSLTSLFQNCSSLTTIIGLNTWDTSNVASMDQFVNGCPLLSNMNVSNWDVGKCVNFASALRGTAMTTLDLTNWNPGSKLSGTPNVNLANFIRDSKSLTTVIAPNLVNEKVTSLSYSFNSCSALTSLDMSDWDVSNVVDMSYLFQGCSALTSLDLSNWNTSNVTSMNGMFNGCSKLVDLKTDFTLNKTNMNGFLYSCSSLADLTNVKLRGTVTSINAFAYHVPSLTLDLSTLDCTYETEGMNIYTFINSKIEHFYPPTNLSKSIDIRHTSTLSIDSIVRIFTNLISTTEALTVTLSAGVLNKLTDEQIAIATNKGWTITAP